MEIVRFHVLSLSLEIKLRETQVSKSIFFSSQQHNYNKRNLVLLVKSYRSKFADGGRRL